jgi:hypothetical protein
MKQASTPATGRRSPESVDPKTLERKLNFGCGAILGFAVLFFWCLNSVAGVAEALGLAAAAGLVCGFLAARFGQRFFDWIFNFLSWL